MGGARFEGYGKSEDVDFLDSLVKIKGFDAVGLYFLSPGRAGLKRKSTSRLERPGISTCGRALRTSGRSYREGGLSSLAFHRRG